LKGVYIEKKQNKICLKAKDNQSEKLLKKELKAILNFSKNVRDISEKISVKITTLIDINNSQIESFITGKICLSCEYIDFLKEVAKDNISQNISKKTKSFLSEKDILVFNLIIKILDKYSC